MAILAPLWINLWGQQPFDLPKAALVRTLVWLLAGMALAEGALNGQPLWAKLRAVPLLGPVILLTLVIATTTATSVDWRLSLWGSYERSQGALTLLTYLLLFVLAASRFKSVPLARETAAAMAAAGAPLLLFSYAQAAGWNLFGLLSDARSPIYATLGRANFAGAYLAILLPVTLALLLTTRGRPRLAWTLLFAGELLGIGLTLARSAWLAAVVALALFALLWYGPRLARTWRRLAWSGISLLFLSGPLVVLALGRFELGSTAARLSIWRGVTGRTSRTDNNYGFYTTDNLYSLNYHTAGAFMQVMQYNGAGTVSPGDVVVFSGIDRSAAAVDGPLVQVTKATLANSTAVAGVVYSRFNIDAVDPALESPNGSLSAAMTDIEVTPPGDASPGEYVLVVAQGPALVKASAVDAGAIQPGDLLSTAGAAGLAAKAQTTTVDGSLTSLPGTVFGKALEPLDGKQDMIYVYVTLQ